MLIKQKNDGTAELVTEPGLRTAVRMDGWGRVSGDAPLRPTICDDFVGDVIADQWAVAKGSDAACVDFAVVAGVNGVAQATMGAGAGASMAANGVQLHSQLSWKANSGGLVMETRVQLAAITNVALFVGFTDQIASLEMPFTLGGSDALTSNATDAVGFLFDTAADTDNWWAVGVANDVDGTKVNSGLAPTAATYDTLRVEVDTGGLAMFWINNTKIGTMSASVTPTVALTPVIAGFRRTASSTTVLADYVFAQSARA